MNKHQTVIYTSSDWTLPFSDLSFFAFTHLSCDFFQWRCMQGICCAAITPPPRCLLVFNETFYNHKYTVNAFRVIVCTIVLISLALISTSSFPQTFLKFIQGSRVFLTPVVPLTTEPKINNLLLPDENSIEQCFAANIVQYCQQY